MAFNDEDVVRAVSACQTPIVCAVGHETDFTLADLAADRRAPTPSAAAELVSPDVRERRLSHDRLRGNSLIRRLEQAHPGRRLMRQQQRLDELEARMSRRLRQRMDHVDAHLAHLVRRLAAQTPRRRIRLLAELIGALDTRLRRATVTRLVSAKHRADALTRELNAVSPLATLGRGYAIVRRELDGSVVTRASAVDPGETVETQLAAGSLVCRIEVVRD